MSRTPARVTQADVAPPGQDDHERFIFDEGAADSGLPKKRWTTNTPMSNLQIPAAGTVTPTTPLRLDVAAKLVFPDGSLTASALRRMITTGKLEGEFIAGKWFTTLSAVERMRSRCRVPAKDPDLNSNTTGTAHPNGSSETADKPLALDAMNATAKSLKENLQNTSSKSTIRQKHSTAIIPIRQK
jgi:hypothetical protein